MISWLIAFGKKMILKNSGPRKNEKVSQQLVQAPVHQMGSLHHIENIFDRESNPFFVLPSCLLDTFRHVKEKVRSVRIIAQPCKK